MRNRCSARRFNVKAVVGIMVASVVWVMTSSAAVVTQYSFEDNLNDTGTGSSVSDTLTYAQGTSGSGSAVYLDGVVGKAVVFDGNYFFAADSIDVGLTGTVWTIEAFIKASAHNATWDRLILKWDGGTDYHFALETGDINLL